MLKKIKSLIAVAIMSINMVGVCSNTYAEEKPVMIESWENMLAASDDEIREMFDIYDKNKKPSLGQRILYILSKPITDFQNDILGEDLISYGGGKILREKITNLFK